MYIFNTITMCNVYNVKSLYIYNAYRVSQQNIPYVNSNFDGLVNSKV